MGWHRPFRLVLLPAVVALALVLLPDGGTEVAAAGPAIRGTVTAAGTAVGAETGWSVEHLEPGVYRVAVPAAEVDVVTWDGTPEVTVVPLGHEGVEVRFRLEGIPVDAGFSFTARPR